MLLEQAMNKKQDYTLHKFPPSRQFTLDIGKIGMKKHHVKALVQVDVTESRKKIRQIRNEKGRVLSFTSWLLVCIGRAIEDHPGVHALRKGRSRLVVFRDIDISMMVEKDVDNVPVPIPLVIRNVNKKDVTGIYKEIEDAKAEQLIEGSDYVLGKDRKKDPARVFAVLPQWIRLLAWKLLLSNPVRVKKMMGTVMVTSVGMMGKAGGWIIPYSIHPVCLAMGSIEKRPGVDGDTIDIREYLDITILMDHDVIDGAPAARFVSRLSELIEGGYGL
jgi:pyruvate/2-oxoglutarate dehydrogenase complex dihydrolipoamide acyltransferase (E2) component